MIISILEFIKTGKFGSVEIGQSVDEVRRVFPKPDDVSRMSKGVYIWRYSAFEFHFADGDLISLWCDNLPYLKKPGKKQFKWDYWILRKYVEPITLAQFISEIKERSIPYILSGAFYSGELLPDNVMLSITGTDSVVYFENLNEKADSIYAYELIAIGASKLKSTYKIQTL
jgi:hypothetical protein